MNAKQNNELCDRKLVLSFKPPCEKKGKNRGFSLFSIEGNKRGITIQVSTSGIFDVFPDGAGRQAHFNWEFTTLLFSKLPELQALEPTIELIDIVATTINKNIPNWD